MENKDLDNHFYRSFYISVTDQIRWYYSSEYAWSDIYIYTKVTDGNTFDFILSDVIRFLTRHDAEKAFNLYIQTYRRASDLASKQTRSEFARKLNQMVKEYT